MIGLDIQAISGSFKRRPAIAVNIPAGVRMNCVFPESNQAPLASRHYCIFRPVHRFVPRTNTLCWRRASWSSPADNLYNTIAIYWPVSANSARRCLRLTLFWHKWCQLSLCAREQTTCQSSSKRCPAGNRFCLCSYQGFYVVSYSNASHYIDYVLRQYRVGECLVVSPIN